MRAIVSGQQNADAPPAHQSVSDGATSMSTPLPASIDALLDLCGRYLPPNDLELIRGAYEVAEAAHQGIRRKSGEPFIEHPVAVATLLGELAIDAPGIAAALLHDTVEDTTLNLDDVRERFGAGIAAIVDGVTKFVAVEPVEPEGEIVSVDARKRKKARQQSETVRKLFLAMSEDPRVVLVKLADRLHNMRTLGSMPPEKREAIARETLDIYAPLAGRIGLYLVKSELEDLGFLYLEPEMFAHVSARLEDEMMKRAEWAKRMCRRVQRELAAQGIQAAVNYRLKHTYRAYREAEDSGMDIAGLHDLVAFRVLVDIKDDCYQALRVIHHLWHPHTDRIRDYIATPKINGYQSFHTAVFALDGRLAQMHIRTHRMHRAAQHGVATYWLERAAHGERVDGATPVRVAEVLGWVTHLAAWQRELDLNASDFMAAVRGDLFEEQIHVFTPKGQIRELPEGSTVLDFAYLIHTEIGNHAVGAHVQTNTSQGILIAREVEVDYILRRSDIVRVLTSPDAAPDASWLDIARTRYAREKIGRALRRTLDDAERTRHVSEPATLSSIVEPLRHPSGKLAQVELGRCCFPCPGDHIAGLAGAGRRVTIHRACCRTLHGALARRYGAGTSATEPLAVIWPEIQPITYRVHLEISGQDHPGLMNEVARCAANIGINVSGGRAYANQSRHRAAMTLTLDVPPNLRLDFVLRRLHTVPGVLDVQRDMMKGCDEKRQ